MIVRFRCGRHSIVFSLAQGEVVCAVVDADTVTREDGCSIDPIAMVHLIDGLQELLEESERLKGGQSGPATPAR